MSLLKEHSLTYWRISCFFLQKIFAASTKALPRAKKIQPNPETVIFYD